MIKYNFFNLFILIIALINIVDAAPTITTFYVDPSTDVYYMNTASQCSVSFYVTFSQPIDSSTGQTSINLIPNTITMYYVTFSTSFSSLEKTLVYSSKGVTGSTIFDLTTYCQYYPTVTTDQIVISNPGYFNGEYSSLVKFTSLVKSIPNFQCSATTAPFKCSLIANTNFNPTFSNEYYRVKLNFLGTGSVIPTGSFLLTFSAGDFSFQAVVTLFFNTFSNTPPNFSSTSNWQYGANPFYYRHYNSISVNPAWVNMYNNNPNQIIYHQRSFPIYGPTNSYKIFSMAFLYKGQSNSVDQYSYNGTGIQIQNLGTFSYSEIPPVSPDLTFSFENLPTFSITHIKGKIFKVRRDNYYSTNLYNIQGSEIKYPFDFPFGYLYANQSVNLQYSITMISPQRNEANVFFRACSQSWDNLDCGSDSGETPIAPIPEDIIPPELLLVQFSSVGNGSVTQVYIVAGDNTAVYKISSNFMPDITVADSIGGFVEFGVYYLNFSIALPLSVQPKFLEITVYDTNSNSKTYNSNTPYISSQMTKLPTLPLYLTYQPPLSDLEITSIEWLNNNVDTCVTNFWINTTLLFNLSNADIHLTPSVTIFTSYNSSTPLKYIGFWSSSSNKYEIEISIPPYLFPGIINYELYIAPYYFYSYDISDLYTTSILYTACANGNSYQMPPMITDIYIDVTNVVLTTPNTTVDTEFQITIDSARFSHGYIHITSEFDFVGYKFNFTNLNLISQVFFAKLSLKYGLTSQSYQITYAELHDLSGHMSSTSPYSINSMGYLTNTYGANVTGIAPQYNDLPKLSSFSTVTGSIDVTIENSFLVNYAIDCGSIACSTKNHPIVYLQGYNQTILQCVTSITSNVQPTSTTYNSNCTVPIGFGYGKPLLLSIYGISNSYPIFTGYSSLDLKAKNFSWFINTGSDQQVFPSLTTGSVTYLLGDETTTLKVLGYNFGTNQSEITVVVNQINYTIFSFFSNSEIRLTVSTLNKSSPWDVYLIYQNQHQSNTIMVTPSVIFPSTKPSSCSTDCGIKEGRGICQGTICKCNSPWLGADCSGKVIPVEEPPVNPKQPDYKVDLPPNEETNEIEYTTLVNMHSIREFNFRGQLVRSATFKNWQFTNNATGTSRIYTTKPFTDTNTTVQTTMRWFETQQIIQFAGNNITIPPNSLKYNIKVENHSFLSPTNSLQLVMIASIQQSSTMDSCSKSNFQNDPNEKSQYVQVQVNDHSLLGRFITTGIFDNSDIGVVESKLLDDIKLPQISSQSRSVAIGTNIGHFNQKVELDPDFSLLVHLDKTNAEEDGLCSANDKSSKSLTKTQLIGIIVGSVAGFCCIAVIVGYLLYQKFKYSKVLYSIRSTLKLK